MRRRRATPRNYKSSMYIVIACDDGLSYARVAQVPGVFTETRGAVNYCIHHNIRKTVFLGATGSIARVLKTRNPGVCLTASRVSGSGMYSDLAIRTMNIRSCDFCLWTTGTVMS